MDRRNFLLSSASAAAVAPISAQAAPPSASGAARKIFVLVHGSWHGAWCWGRVENELAKEGHRVFAITQTGVGERKHLAAAASNIDVFVDDIVNLIESEELTSVTLVGHSFGGIPITGVAARMPDRIRKLVYLDAGVPGPGESALSALAPEEQERRRKAAVKVNGVDLLMAPATLPGFWGVSGEDAQWVRRRLTPHPFATYTSGLQFDPQAWDRVPRCYIQSTAPRHPALGEQQARLKQDSKWEWLEIPAGHDSMVSHPRELAGLLMGA